MVRGTRPKPEIDPEKERIITWRISGKLHALLSKITIKLGTSNNAYLTRIMRPHIEAKHKELFEDGNSD